MKANKTMIFVCSCALLLAALVSQLGCATPRGEAATQIQTTTPPPEAGTTTPPRQTTTPIPPISQTTEPRVWNPRTIPEAEATTGYDIYTPAYIPEGFTLGSSIMTSRHGFGEDSPKSVERMWVWKGQRDMGLNLVQMERPFDIGGGEPAEINGMPGQRAFHPADGQRPASLTIGWDQFGASFALSAVLVDSVDEQEILKVAASLEHIQ